MDTSLHGHKHVARAEVQAGNTGMSSIVNKPSGSRSSKPRPASLGFLTNVSEAYCTERPAMKPL